MKFRIVEIDCPESKTHMCCIVESKTLFGWKPCLTTYDRGGREMADHFPSPEAAKRAFDKQTTLNKDKRTPYVVQQWEVKGA